MRRRFVVDRWWCMYANWVLRQLGIILDKYWYLIKKEERQLTFSKRAVDTPGKVL